MVGQGRPPSFVAKAMSHMPIIDPEEPPRARARRKLTCIAHRALAELIAELVEADARPISASAASRQAGIRIVVRLVRYAGPAWEPSQDSSAFPSAVPSVLPFRAVERAVLKAAPGPTETPATIKQLARRAGYGNNGHFQEAVRSLIDRGLLVRVRGGIRRCSGSAWGKPTAW